jgi:hypothetical protein
MSTLKIAEAQADRIYDHWRARGYEIEAHVIVTRGRNGEPEYTVRTNLIAGLPRGAGGGCAWTTTCMVCDAKC